MKFRILPAAAALALASTGALAQNSNQGVSKTEITLGSIQDLSGPIAGFGKQVRLGMMLRVDEVNEQGGIHGRKIVLKVEDSAYDPKKAVLAAQKLVNQDKIFAMVGHIGTAQNLATFPVLFEKNIINFFPVTAAKCTSRSTGSSTPSPPPTSTRCGWPRPNWSRKRARRRSAPCTRTTSSGWKCCAAPRRA